MRRVGGATTGAVAAVAACPPKAADEAQARRTWGYALRRKEKRDGKDFGLFLFYLNHETAPIFPK
jgi:hypothetical protein